MYLDIRLTVFAPQDGTMALPHPLVCVLHIMILSHPKQKIL